MLPMGTIMAATMLVGASYGALQMFIKPLQKQGQVLSSLVAGIVLLGGLWNVFWYASQHISEFWGQAAFVSGTLMIITALSIYKITILPKFLQLLRPIVILALFGCSFLYGYTIYHL